MDLLEISEAYIPGVGNVKLSGMKFIYSDRKDQMQRQGLRLMMNNEVAMSCLGWETIGKRLLVTHFVSKKCRESVIVIYAPVEPTDGNRSGSDKFYLKL